MSAARFHPLVWGAAAVLLLLPAAAMQVSDVVDWGADDFAAFGLILTLFCLSIEAAWYWLAAPWWRLGAAILAVLAFLMVWAHLAVGLFD
jgi:hypothetical protein